jgi:hypothetical protein
MDELDAIATLDTLGGDAPTPAASGCQGSTERLHMTFSARPSAKAKPAARSSRASSSGGGSGVRGAAQRRHRQRQKESMASLNAQLAERRAQVQQLTQHNQCLRLKTEVLEKVVGVCETQISMLEQHMGQATLGGGAGAGGGGGAASSPQQQAGQQQQQTGQQQQQQQQQWEAQQLEQQLRLPPDEGGFSRQNSLPDPDLPADFSHIDVCARWGLL